MKTIRLNSEDEDVIQLQIALKEIGYDNVWVTGHFDENTNNAILNFQESQGLSADGIVGRKTWLALQSKDTTAIIILDEKILCSVVFESNISEDRRKVVSSKTISLLKRVADTIGQTKIIITSTIRLPRIQAITMYNNLERGNNIRYKQPGEDVKTIYHDSATNGDTKDMTLDKMVAKIEELSAKGQRVSKHCVSLEDYSKLNVIDISYRNLDRVKFIDALSKEDSIKRIIHNDTQIASVGTIISFDRNEPCIHLEVEQ